jgi:hypothetical protein
LFYRHALKLCEEVPEMVMAMMPEIPVSVEVQHVAVAAMQMMVVTAMAAFVAGPVAISNTHFIAM